MSVFIERIKIKNLLSFDEEGIDFELKPLNVLIGANASGKSNFVAAIQFLMSASYDLKRGLDRLGGWSEARWKGSNSKLVHISSTMHFENLEPKYPRIGLNYDMQFGYDQNRVVLHQEELGVFSGEIPREFNADWVKNKKDDEPLYYLSYPPSEWMDELHSASFEIQSARLFGDATVNSLTPCIINGQVTSIPKNNFQDRSRTLLGNSYHNIMWLITNVLNRVENVSFFPVFGTLILQTPNEAGVPQEQLARDAANLASHLAVLNDQTIVERFILPKVAEVYPNIIRIGTTIRGGRVFITITEKNLLQTVLQMRMSDGLLRFIATLSVLYQDNPPPLLCLEEPENGLHPEVIPVLAKAIKEASERTQIIITTHSAELLSYLDPEDIVTCERGESGGTKLVRLEKKRLSDWLDDYSLGDLWLKGILGGTRY